MNCIFIRRALIWLSLLCLLTSAARKRLGA